MRKVPSRTVQVLDEEATAIQIAESAGQRQWLPVFQPDSERWLDLTLVVEQSRSTMIWQELIAEFQTLLERQGAFRSIRTWNLQFIPVPSTPGSSPGPTSTAVKSTMKLCPKQTDSLGESRPRSAKELLDPAGRQLILLISDCVSPLWRQAAIHPVLKQWADAGPIAIVQLLPEHLWTRSALGLGFPVQLSALAPGMASPQLDVAELPAWESVDLATALTLPVVTLEPESLTQWATVVAGMGKAQMAGLVFDLAFVQRAAASEVQERTPRENPRENPKESSLPSPEALVKQFRATASPLARRLAGLMSLVPVSLPVIHLIQETVLPASRQVHVAEIFMSGLMQTLANQATETGIEPGTESPSAYQPAYEFIPGVRELLRASVPKTETLTVLDQVSQYIAHRAGLSIKSFAALLSINTVTDIGNPRLGAEIRQFAELSADTLRRMGGEYAALLEQVEVPVRLRAQRLRSQGYQVSALRDLEQEFELLKVEIANAFRQADPRFFFLDAEELEISVLKVVLAENEPITIDILGALAWLDEPEAQAKTRFDVWIDIDFAVTVTHPQGRRFISGIQDPEVPQIVARTFPGQVFSTMVEVHTSRTNNQSPQLTIESIQLTMNQPIAVGYDEEIPEPTPYVTLQSFEFEVATITLDPDSDPIPATDLQPFSFQIAILQSQKTGLFRNQTQWVVQRQPGQGMQLVEDLGNGVVLEMVQIPAGTFLMGSPETELERSNSEGPQHTVTLPTFFMGKYPVTQAQWRAVAALPQVDRKLDPDPSYFKGDNRPAEGVSWYEAVEFCARLSAHTGREYRLPSEAEWEYACRAGTETSFHFGETITTDLANYNGNYTYGPGPKGTYPKETTPVGSFQVANAFGLYDLHGNVWEWCADHWHDSYEGAPTDGSAWLTENENQYRLLRGGSWILPPSLCRSAFRLRPLPGLRNDSYGFRVASATARTLPSPSTL
jgi:formylglycine-generating enzyme required for sulfatase activity